MSYLPYSIVLALASFICIGLGIYGWQHRDRPGMLAFSIFMFLFAIWPMAQAFDIITANLPLKIFLMKIRIDAPVFAGLAYLVMVLQLIGRANWVNRRRLFVLSIIPLLGAFFNWTSPNILFRYNFHINLSGPFPILLWSNGPFFYIWFLYATVLFFVPLFLLLFAYRNISLLSSRQVIILIVATLIPLVTNILFQIFAVTPIKGFNITPVTQVFMGLIIAWGIFYYKAFDMVPIARSKLIADMKDGMMALDIQNLIVDINPAAEQMTGLAAKTILGKPAKEVFASWPDLINRFKDVEEDQKEITVGEKPNYYDLRITSLKDQKRNKMGRMLILRDITERKLAEKRKQELLEMEKQLTEELQSSNEELQVTTEELTNTNEELIQAQDNLKELVAKLKISNKELEHFAYVASHDLQEPLRMVSSFSQLLERNYKNKLDTDADEYIEFIVEGSQRMKYLIDDLLTFSRVSSEAKEFEKVDLENVLDIVLSNLSVSIDESNAHITHDSLPTVIADRSQMTQVFQNLIYNAIKFHGHKTPEIHIAAEKHGIEWRFSVTDNGIGIDPEYQKQIFEVFKRLHTREEYPGSGIGLSVTQKIIKRHGGNIWVESELGEGSTFYFTIPIS